MRKSEHKVYLESGVASAIVEAANTIVNRLNRPILVNHTIERKPPPRPVRCQIVISNPEGYRWMSSPIDLTYHTSIPVLFPLSAASGRPEDTGQQCSMHLEMNYS